MTDQKRTADAQTGQDKARDDKSREANIIRHLKHNHELKAQKEMRIYGGFQRDMFRDNDTGQDLFKAA